jgi:hypothetical protein
LAFELKDVYKLSRHDSVARIKLVSAKHTHSLIDATTKSLQAFAMEERFAHFTVS